uniref:Expressed conserved protein n=1 Tax=Panagrellus redivivus TaxID=6233 RepID=A0A7E4ZV16_PANRE
MNPHDGHEDPLMTPPPTPKSTRRFRVGRRSSLARKIGFGSSAPVRNHIDLSLSARTPSPNKSSSSSYVTPLGTPQAPRRSPGVMKRLRRALSFGPKHHRNPVTPSLESPTTGAASSSESSSDTSMESVQQSLATIEARENMIRAVMDDIHERMAYHEASVAILKRCLHLEAANLARYQQKAAEGNQELDQLQRQKAYLTIMKLP